MPEPNTPDSSGSQVPPFPPSDKKRGVSREANEDIGYGFEDPSTTSKIRAEAGDTPLWLDPEAMSAQQAINEQGAQTAWLNTPDGKRFTELTQKLENGEQLSSDESQELARIKARRENR